MRPLAVALTLVTLAGCGNAPCTHGTLLVTLSFVGGAQSADSFDITLGVDGGSPQHHSVSRTPGRSSDSLIIKFGDRYPAGHAMSLTVVALASGAPLATSAVDSFTAPAGCGSRSLTLDGNAGDLAMPPLDLGSGIPDLAPPPDLRLYRYPAAVLQDGPVGYFRLGERSGALAKDETGGASGTILGTPSLGVPGALVGDPDTAFDFAASGLCDLNDRFTFAGTAPFSVEAWVKYQGSGGWDHIVTKEQRSGPKQGWALLVTISGQPMIERLVADIQVNVIGSVLPLGVWTHLVATYDGSMLGLYVNGMPAGTQADSRSLPSHTTHALIGDGDLPPAASRFIGQIDEVAVFDKVLSLTRVQAHWAAGR